VIYGAAGAQEELVMILTNRQIVWTPVLGPDSLAVALDRTFAEACIAHKHQDMKVFVEGVWKFMGNEPPVEPSNFLDIYQGLLPKGFYAGHDGLWLTLDHVVSNNAKRPLVYHGHNEDHHVADRWWLLQAFAAWAEAATTVLQWE